ncbi:hypothetical protein VPH35_129302 [Triticum aestivum]
MQIWERIKIPSRISIATRPGISISLTLLLHLRLLPRPGRRGGAPPTSSPISIHHSTITSIHQRHATQHLHHAPPAPLHSTAAAIHPSRTTSSTRATPSTSLCPLVSSVPPLHAPAAAALFSTELLLLPSSPKLY